MKKRNHQASTKSNLQSAEIRMLLEGLRIQKRRARVSMILAVIVAFVTVGNLSFPAKTLTATDAVLDGGYAPHQHTDACYQEVTDENGNTSRVLTCGQQVLHTHSDSCYDENGDLVCGLLQPEESQYDDISMAEVPLAVDVVDVNEENSKIADAESDEVLLAGDVSAPEEKGDAAALQNAVSGNRADAGNVTGTVNGRIPSETNKSTVVTNSDEAGVNEVQAGSEAGFDNEVQEENASFNNDAQVNVDTAQDLQNAVPGDDGLDEAVDAGNPEPAVNNLNGAADAASVDTEVEKSGQNMIPENSGSNVWKNTRKTLKRWRMSAEADGVRVVVTAAYGAFPEGTTMKIQSVTDNKVMDSVRAAVREDAAEIKAIEALDISFYNDGKEIEPSLPVHVTMASEKNMDCSDPKILSDKPDGVVIEL